MTVAFRNAHALVIGVGGDLPVTVDDARAIARILSDPNRCAVPAANVLVQIEMDATRSGIIDALQELAAKATSEDAVTIYYSGHGAMLPGPPERRFLVPREGEWLEGKQFTALLRNIPAHRLLVLLDCCYAGGVHTGLAAKSPGVKSVPVPFDARDLRLREGAGTVVISSSKADEFSLTGTPYSIFTQVVIDALCGSGARQDGYVRAADLAMYVSQWVPVLTQDSQHPQLDLEAADNYPIAYYAAGGKDALGRPAWFIDALTGRAQGQPAPTSTGSTETPLSIHDAILQLRDILAEWIYEEDEARRIVRDGGARAGSAWRSGDSESFWQSELDKAHRAWRMEKLFKAADKELGDNPGWRNAKQEYRTACEAEQRPPIRPVDNPEPVVVDRTLIERRLGVLEGALGHIAPPIFSDSRVRDDKLDAANTALMSFDRLVGALSAAAKAETTEPRRGELQRLGYNLREHYNAVSQKLFALEQVRSEEEAVQPCEELAAEAADLLAECSRAIQVVT